MDNKQISYYPVVITLLSEEEVEELYDALNESPVENRTEKLIREFLVGACISVVD